MQHKFQKAAKNINLQTYVTLMTYVKLWLSPESKCWFKTMRPFIKHMQAEAHISTWALGLFWLLLVFGSTALIWHFRRLSFISPAQWGYLLPLHAIENLSRTFQLWSPPDSDWSKHRSSCSSEAHRLLRCRCSLNTEVVKNELWGRQPYGSSSPGAAAEKREGKRTPRGWKGGVLLTNPIKDSWSPWEKQTLLLR